MVTDRDGRTKVAGLLAAGEVAHTGLHGANRLASNSRLEAVVFAARAARQTTTLLEATLPEVGVPRRSLPDGGNGREPAVLRREVGQLMWEDAGIVRTDQGLAEVGRRLDALVREVPHRPSDPDAAEAANLWLVARLVVASASLRKESRGLHFNASHPGMDPAFQRDTILHTDHFEELSR